MSRRIDQLSMDKLAACVQAAICAKCPASTPEESYKKFKLDFGAVKGCIHHWADVVKWLKTGEWPDTQASTVVYELERLAAISRANKDPVIRSKVGGCQMLLRVMRWSPETTSA